MIPLISLIVVVLVSMIVVRIASVALTLTGLSNELARFQARSAFSGTGFSTTESEKVVRHPVRRRIIMLLMLLGNAGIVTAMSSLILSFIGTQQATGITGSIWFRITCLLSSLSVLWMFAHSQWIDRKLSRFIRWALKRWTSLEVRDYAGLLHLTGDYVVLELNVEADDWLANQALTDLKLADEGVLVLGIEKANGNYLGAPRGKTILDEDDTLLLYGRQEVIANLDERRSGASGNWEHHKAIGKQIQIEREEEEELQQPDSSLAS